MCPMIWHTDGWLGLLRFNGLRKKQKVNVVWQNLDSVAVSQTQGMAKPTLEKVSVAVRVQQNPQAGTGGPAEPPTKYTFSLGRVCQVLASGQLFRTGIF